MEVLLLLHWGIIVRGWTCLFCLSVASKNEPILIFFFFEVFLAMFNENWLSRLKVIRFYPSKYRQMFSIVFACLLIERRVIQYRPIEKSSTCIHPYLSYVYLRWSSVMGMNICFYNYGVSGWLRSLLEVPAGCGRKCWSLCNQDILLNQTFYNPDVIRYISRQWARTVVKRLGWISSFFRLSKRDQVTL